MPAKDEIIKRLIEKSAEIITPEEFSQRLDSAEKLTHYIGFEISGYVHIGQGIMSALVMRDLTDLGVNCTVWLADWHTAINEKLDGTRETAARIGQGYFTEAMKAAYLAVGGSPEDIRFRLATDWYAKDALAYRDLVVRIMQNVTLGRLQRSVDIMGRKAGEGMTGAQLMYPAMQVADIFYQDINIAHAGMDQRKAHVIMRDVADKVYAAKPKPIALHHPLLNGLQKPTRWPIPEEINEREVIMDMKMSKSDPRSALWVHDSPEEIEQKIRRAFCPEKETKYNPILNWAKHLLFWDREGKPFRIERKPEHGGDVEFSTYKELEQAYAAGEVHPMDLKAAVAQELIDLLAPVREHFAKPEISEKKKELDDILAKK